MDKNKDMPNDTYLSEIEEFMQRKISSIPERPKCNISSNKLFFDLTLPFLLISSK